MTHPNKNKKIAVVLLSVFVFAIGGLILLWLLAGNSDTSRTGGATASYGSQASSETNGRTSGGASPFTESVLVREEAHRLVEETAGHLIEKGQMAISEVVEYRKQLEAADKLYNRGDYDPALAKYETISGGIRSRLQAGEAQANAEKLGKELLDKIRASAHLEQFAPAAWAAAVKLSDEGTVAYKQGRYAVANERFESGLEQIATAEEVREQKIEAELQAVKDSMQALELDAAQRSLDLLAQWAPEHSELPGLRAQLQELKTLLPDLQKGKQLMQAQRYREAMQHYAALRKNYPHVSVLGELHQQARRAFLDAEVRPLVAQAEKLFKEGKLDEALALLKQALSLAPEEKDIPQAIAAVEKAIKERKIEELLARAYDLYELQEWKRARQVYQEVIDLDPNNEEAKQGSLEAGRRMNAEIRFQERMKIATEHADAGRFPNALESFNQAMAIMPDYLSLTSEQQALRDLLQRQKEKVKVTIKSDNDTWVSVIGALPPDKFREETLELYPDVYTIKGQRTGYEPVEFEYRVNADNAPIKITVIANERS